MNDRDVGQGVGVGLGGGPGGVDAALVVLEQRGADQARVGAGEAKGRLRGKQPKLKPAQEAHLVTLWREGTHTGEELAGLFSVSRSTVYRAVERAEPPPEIPPAPPTPPAAPRVVRAKAEASA